MKNKFVIAITLFLAICIAYGCSFFVSTDYSHNYEFVYINQTDYTLKFKIDPAWHNQNIFECLPQSSNNVLKVQLEGGKNMRPKETDQIMLNNLLCSCLLGDCTYLCSIIFVDEISCVEICESGFVKISNYQCKVLGKRYVRYTYTFTEADFVDAKPCNGNLNKYSEVPQLWYDEGIKRKYRINLISNN